MSTGCCSCNFKTATHIIAILDIIVGSFFGIYVITMFGLTVFGLYVAFLAALFFATTKLGLGFVLERGADQSNYQKCKAWLIGNAIWLGILVVSVIVVHAAHFQSVEVGLALYFIPVILQLIAFGVVWAFMKQIQVTSPAQNLKEFKRDKNEGGKRGSPSLHSEEDNEVLVNFENPT